MHHQPGFWSARDDGTAEWGVEHSEVDGDKDVNAEQFELAAVAWDPSQDEDPQGEEITKSETVDPINLRTSMHESGDEIGEDSMPFQNLAGPVQYFATRQSLSGALRAELDSNLLFADARPRSRSGGFVSDEAAEQNAIAAQNWAALTQQAAQCGVSQDQIETAEAADQPKAALFGRIAAAAAAAVAAAAAAGTHVVLGSILAVDKHGCVEPHWAQLTEEEKVSAIYWPCLDLLELDKQKAMEKKEQEQLELELLPPH